MAEKCCIVCVQRLVGKKRCRKGFANCQRNEQPKYYEDRICRPCIDYPCPEFTDAKRMASLFREVGEAK